MKSNLLKSIFISLILVMGVNNVWAATAELKNGQYVYFDISSNTGWASDNAAMRFNWFWNTNDHCCWNNGTKIDGTNIYYATTQNAYTRGVQMLRMSSNYGTQYNYSAMKTVSSRSSDNENCVKLPTNGWDNCTLTWGTYVPPMNNVTIANNGTTITSGSGTQADPYIIAGGATVKVKATADLKVPDPSPSIKYKFSNNGGSSYNTESTTNTYTFTAAAYSTSAKTYTVMVSSRAAISTTYNTAKSSSKIYFKVPAQYTVTFNANGHGTAPSSQKVLHGAKAQEPTAPTAAGYTFGGWYKESGCTNKYDFNTVVTSNLTLYAKWTQNATYSLDVQAGTGIASVTGSTDPVTLGNTYNITATPKTGYSFTKWTASPAANATFASATSASTNVTVKNGSVTVTASATENLYTITVQSSNNSHGTVTRSADKAGIATSITITATPESGYRFVNWTTATAGIAIADANNASTTVNATAAGTITANFEEIPLETIYFVNKDGWNNVKVHLWDGDADDTTWPGVSLTKADFQLHCCDVYYYSALPGSYGKCIFSNNGSNQTADLTWTAGKYFYGDTWKTLDELTYEVQLAGTMNNWTAESLTMAADNSTGSLTVALNANQTYEFKIIVDGNNWHGNDGTMTYGNSTEWTMSTSAGDCQITTAGAGNYTFTYNVCTAKLTVTYPTSYTVSYSQQPTAAADKPTTSLSVTSGKYVAAGTSVTFTAKDANNGYTWKGWYDNNAGTGTALSADKEYENSITANTTIYAVYTVNTYSITYNLNGGTNPDGIATQYQVTTANITLPTNPTRTGYTFVGWHDNDELTGDAITQITKGSYGNKEYWAKWTPNIYTITWDANGGSVDPASSTYTYDGDPVTMPTPTRTGYTFNGWFTAETGGTQVNNVGKDNKPTSNVTYYAQWTANTYTVTLSQTGAATQGTTSVPATYDADMPNIPELPTAENGYAFMGYWDSENGTGKLYYNAGGTSAQPWDKADNATLYAYFQKAQITEITLNKDAFDPVEAGGEEEFVLATPTISPEPEGNIVVCWRLLYNNGNEVAEYEVSNEGCEENQVKFPIAGLAAGTYQIEATLYTGTACGSGTPLDTLTKNFLIASGYTVTIKYTCDGTTIQPSTTAPGQATEETEITAPDIFGYTFKEWVAGDGVTIKSTSDDKKTITYTAYYDGYLTATYTQQTNIIYFNNTLGWENVYVYFYTGDFWSDSHGSGAVNSDGNGSYKGYAEMEPLGDSTIWYATNTYSDISQISFTPTDQNGQQYFKSSEAIHTWSFDSRIPMYVPIKADEEKKSYNNTTTKYYNKGYWMNYPNNTGYTLRIFSQIEGDGTMDLAAIPFQFSEDKKMPMTIDVELGSNQTYGYKIYRADDKWFGNNGTMTYDNSGDEEQELWPFDTDTKNCGLTTTIPGTYTFTLNYQEIDDSNSQYNYTVGVKYPGAVGDYRVLYTDTAATNWSGNTRTNNWYHPSKLIINKEEGNDTISFFVNKDKQPTLQIQQIKSISNTGAITWENVGEAKPINVDKDTTYNFIFTHTESALELVGQPEIYTGSYYVRSYALNGRWLNYKTDTDNRMTYSAFSESDANSFGDKYSHYITKWCEEGTNVKFVVANEFSPCLTDTLIKDIGDRFQNIKDDGSLNSENGKYKANVRFMWNRATNKISRAYVGSASEATRQFLVLKADREIKNETGQELSNEGDSHNYHRAVFNDTQNWIYERTIQVQPQTRVKLYACYPITQTIDTINAQYFRGAYDDNKFDTDENSVQILGGQGTAWNTMRIIYDFKTNRLLAAWVPSEDITGEKAIAADVMILREHQKDATCITLTNDESKLAAVKNVYGVLRINRWILNNRGNADDLSLESCTRKEGNQTIYDENTTNTNHPVLEPGEQIPIHERGNYFISFPFDVHLSDVFGFGQYGTHWIISDYNGLRRAKRGFFYDNCVNEDCTNWDYIWEPDTFVMKANKGYLLSLDLDLMKHDNIDFWAHNVCQVELFFPSTIELKTIERTNYQMDGLSEEYLCKINHNKDGNNPEGDRRVKDSYWRCIGVPSFANYDGSLTEGENGTNIIWKTDYTWTADESGFPFLYEWNTTDNSLTPRSTSSYKFRPTFAYLIQNGNPIYWSVVNTKPASIVAKEKQQTTRNYEWKITLKCNNKQDDQTFIRMTDYENVTTDFDFNQDLVKEFNYGRSDIYTLIGYEKAAANSLPFSEQTTLIPLGLSIEYNGDYTIAMPDGTANIGVTLIDTESNTRTNLSAGMEYTLTLKKGDYNNRFFIEISPIQQTPTDIEYVENSHDNQARKVLIDNILYIVRDGQIFDARGAKVK